MLLRGSVFFIGMCLWGSQRVPNLKYSNTTVLPSMLQVRNCHQCSTFIGLLLFVYYCIAFHVTSKELPSVLHIYWIVIVGIVYSAFLQNNAKKRMFRQLTEIGENLQIIIANGLCFDVMVQCVYSLLSFLPPRRGISSV